MSPEQRSKHAWLQDYFLYAEIPRLLRNVINVLLGVSITWALFMSVGHYFGYYFHPISYLFVVFLALMRLWSHFDESHRPAFVLVWGFFVLFVPHLYLNGGLFAPIMLFVPSVVGVSYALMGVRWGHITLASYIVTFAVISWMDTQGMLPISMQTHTPLSMWLVATVIVAVSAMIFLAVIVTYEQASKIRLRELEYRREAEQNLRALSQNLEKRVDERTQSLSDSLKTLESFAFSVTHDLKAPLRGMQMQVQDLIDHPALVNDSAARKSLERMAINTRFMQRHIEDLLHFARLGHKGIKPRPIFLPLMIEEVKNLLMAKEEKRNVVWSIGVLGEIHADPDMIKLVFLNILDNALKFTRKQSTATIVIDSQKTVNGTMICVRDNGAGFDQSLVDQLFKPFARLHDEEQFEGTGVGLAICARIVELHGGVITAKSRPNEGATICFTLPDRVN